MKKEKDNLNYEARLKQIDKLVNDISNCKDSKVMKALEEKFIDYMEKLKKNKPQPPLLCKTCHWWNPVNGCIREIVPEVKNGVESCRKYEDKSQHRIAVNIVAKIFQDKGFEIIEDKGTHEKEVKLGKGKDGQDVYMFLYYFELGEDLETIRLRRRKNN